MREVRLGVFFATFLAALGTAKPSTSFADAAAKSEDWIQPVLPEDGSTNCTQSFSRALTWSSAPALAVPIFLAPEDGPLRIVAADVTISISLGRTSTTSRAGSDCRGVPSSSAPEGVDGTGSEDAGAASGAFCNGEDGSKRGGDSARGWDGVMSWGSWGVRL